MKIKKTDDLVIAAFERPANARTALAELRDAGHSPDNIGVLTRENGKAEYKSFKELEGNHTAKGAAIGAATGVAGGAVWALGIAAGVLPAIGPVVAGGLLGAVLASGAAGGATGAVAGALAGLGVSDEDAVYYEEELRRGRTVLIVKGDNLGRAFSIMQTHSITRGEPTIVAGATESSAHL